MAITTNWKRLFLRGVKWDAASGSVTLINQLKTVAQARLTDTAKGRALVSTSGNGRTVTFQIPANGAGVTALEIVDLIEELHRLYESAVSYLGGSPTDDQIFAEMLRLLEPVVEVENDFSNLRGWAL